MKNEEEVRKKLKELKEKLNCPKCGNPFVIDFFWDEYNTYFQCPRCGEKFRVRNEVFYWIEALEWVLGEEEVKEDEA